MVYKKYIKRGNKTFGPYYYESYRENGKVKTRFVSGPKNSKSSGNKFFLFGSLILGVCLFFSFSSLAYNLVSFGSLTGFSFFETEKETCIANWVCDEWSDCNIPYEFEALIKDDLSVLGEQTRTCYDLNNCAQNRIETKTCEEQSNVMSRKIKKCFKNYIELYNEESGTISRLELIDQNHKELNLQLIFDDSGYCPYCYDGIKNFDEDEIDCVYRGGSCPICKEEIAALKWPYPLTLVFLVVLVILLILSILSYFLLFVKIKTKS